MDKLLIVIVIIAIIIGIEKLGKKTTEEGTFLKAEIAPYYNKISAIVAPYSGSKLAKEVVESAQPCLKRVYQTYQHSNLPKDDINVFLIESYQNSTIVELFALCYIYAYKVDDAIWPSEEEKSARKALKEYCRKKLLSCYDLIPQCFLDEFLINLRDLEKD